MMIFAPLSARFVERVGAKVVVTTGLALIATGLLLATGLDQSSSYGAIAWRMVVMATGMALTMAPATDAIMGSLPLAKAGVGSAVNDTTRQIGGAVGVAVVGSVFSSIYGSQIADAAAGQPVPPAILDGIKDSLGFALNVASQIGGSAGAELASAARAAFIDGFHAGLIVGGVVAAIGAVAVALWLPGRARDEDIERQHAEYDAREGASAPHAEVTS
jgi:hypothetical protein